MPFGISRTPEEFQRRLNEALEGLDGIRTVADDILIWGVESTDSEAHKDLDRKFIQLLQSCEEIYIGSNRSFICLLDWAFL